MPSSFGMLPPMDSGQPGVELAFWAEKKDSLPMFPADTKTFYDTNGYVVAERLFDNGQLGELSPWLHLAYQSRQRHRHLA